MTWLLSFALALLSAVLGCVGSTFLADRCIRWYRISSVEGASSYFLVAVGVLGLVAGFFIGLIVARVVAAGAEPSFLRALAWSFGVTAGLVLVALLLARAAADVPPTIGGRPLLLQVEVRAPAEVPAPERASPSPPFAQVEAFRKRGQPAAWLKTETLYRENGHWVLTAEPPLVSSARKKLLRVYLNPELDLYFPLHLPPRPRREHLQWSGWMPVASEVPHPAGAASYEVRYRVSVVPAPPPPPTPEQAAAAREARAQADFRALDPQGPLRAWLPYTEEWVRADHRQEALRVVQQRPGLVHELKSLMLGPNPEPAAEAFRLIPALEDTERFVPAVRAAGRDLARRLREVVATTPEQDPGYEGAMHLSMRFSGWMSSVRALHQRHGADFTAELQEILVLARQRPDSHALSADVVRVASFYLHEWAGVAPLPSDPPPR